MIYGSKNGDERGYISMLISTVVRSNKVLQLIELALYPNGRIKYSRITISLILY